MSLHPFFEQVLARLDCEDDGDDDDEELARDLALFNSLPPLPGELGDLTPDEMEADWLTIRRRLEIAR